MLEYLWIRGRINRTQFLIASLLLVSLWILCYYIVSHESFEFYLWSTILIILYLFQSVKRAHDFNGSGYLYFFWVVIPFFNVLAFFELHFRMGNLGNNKYGIPSNFSFSNPKIPNYVESKHNDTEGEIITEGEKITEDKKEEKVYTKVIITQKETETCTIFQIDSNAKIHNCYFKSGDFVNKNQRIIEIESYNYFDNNDFMKEINSPIEGFIQFLIINERYLSNLKDSKLATFAIYSNDLDRQNENIKIEYSAIKDSFNNDIIIRWNRIEIYGDLALIVENISGKDFICFEYIVPSLKLIDGDKILIQLSNGEILEFLLNNGKYKIHSGKKGFRIPLYNEDIDCLSKFAIENVRIHLQAENQKIDLTNFSYMGYVKKDFQFLVKATFESYKEIAFKLENYQPLFKSSEDKNLDIINEKCYVYLMVDTNNHYHKIGISNKPTYREKTLQSEKPTIELICHKHFPSRKIAESIEKALHEAYKEKRIRGEWFKLSEGEVNDIINTLR